MITNADLSTQTRRDLADVAREIGVAGWHSMRKDELIDAIRKAQRKDGAQKKDSKKSLSKGKLNAAGPTKATSARKASGDKKGAGQSKTNSARKAASPSKPVTASKAKPSKGAVTGKKVAASSQIVESKRPAEKKSVPEKKTASARGPAAEKKLASEKKIPETSSKRPAKSEPNPDADKAARRQSKNLTGVAPISVSGSKPIVKPSVEEPGKGKSKSKVAAAKVQRPPTAPRIVKVLRKQQAAAESRKDLSACVRVNEPGARNVAAEAKRAEKPDRIVLIVRDSYWLQACWEIGRSSIERARAAMGTDWHLADPILRLMEVADGTGVNAAEQQLRDIPIHGGVNNWYIDVDNPPSRFRVLIGYRAKSGRFYTLCRSNIVQTPAPGACDPIDGHWQDIAEDYERIYSLSENENGTSTNDLRDMFEERLQRPMIDLSSDSAPNGDVALGRERELPFEVDAELIVYGTTAPGTQVTLAGKPVKLTADGAFTVRMELPDRRQVIPVVACSRDGMRQRTTVVAVERNTKVMEQVSRHNME